VIKATEVFELRCDRCGAAFTWEEFEHIAIWNSAREVDLFVREWWASEFGQSEGWSTDGEGTVSCSAHEALVVTQAARDELARVPGPDDVPLIAVEDVTV
jgi:hypothetical protein